MGHTGNFHFRDGQHREVLVTIPDPKAELRQRFAEAYSPKPPKKWWQFWRKQ